MKLVIKNGRVMDPASGRDEVTNIWVEDEKIIGFGEPSSLKFVFISNSSIEP